MNIRPLYNRIVVKRLEEEADKTAGGLFIPDSAKEKPQQGEVVAVGQGKRTDEGKLIPLDVKAGDRIPVNQQTLVGGTTNAVTTTSQYIDTGVLLQVTPHINAGGLVTLDVQAEVRNPGKGVRGAQLVALPDLD